MTGLPRSTLYFFVKQGTFPAPIKIGVRSVGWLESDIAAWQEAAFPHRAADRAASPIGPRPPSEARAFSIALPV